MCTKFWLEGLNGTDHSKDSEQGPVVGSSSIIGGGFLERAICFTRTLLRGVYTTCPYIHPEIQMC
jgi:hypothetical protein